MSRPSSFSAAPAGERGGGLHFWQFVAYLALNASVAGLGVLMLPLAVGALARAGLPSELLGVLAFLELGTSAVIAILASTLVSRCNPILFCVAGACLALLGNGLATFSVSSIAALLASRPVVGMGTGLMLAGGLAIIARQAQPERIYGYVAMAPCCSGLLGFLIAPHLIEWMGSAAGVFAFQAVIALLNAVLLLRDHARIAAYRDRDAADAPVAVPERSPAEARAPLDPVTSAAVLFAILLLAFCDASVWAFVVPIGEGTGIAPANIGNYLVASAAIGCLGPLAAARLGSRAGFWAPLALGQLVMIASTLLLVRAGTPIMYMMLLYLRVFTILFLSPLYQGLCARIDPMGRLVAASAGFWKVGYATGPLAGGVLIGAGADGMLLLGFGSVAAAVASLLLTFLVLGQRRRWAREGLAA